MKHPVMEHYPELKACQKDLDAAERLVISCYSAGGKLLLCGNGGSAADSDHIVGELMKGFLKRRPIDGALYDSLVEKFGKAEADKLSASLQGALPAISLNVHGSLTSAFLNDVGSETVFAQGVMGYGRPGDVLICISTSGNSKNCVDAAEVALAKGMSVIAMTGAKESKLSAIATVTLKAPSTETYRVQEYHLPLYHALCADVEAYFFKE